MFIYSSTCFGHPHAHQELSTCSSSLWFYLRSVVVAVLLVVVGPAGSGCSILIPLASSQHNLYDIYLLLCVRC